MNTAQQILTKALALPASTKLPSEVRAAVDTLQALWLQEAQDKAATAVVADPAIRTVTAFLGLEVADLDPGAKGGLVQAIGCGALAQFVA